MHKEVHSKKFCHGRFFICTLHGGHLQICFSENTCRHATAEELENHYLYLASNSLGRGGAMGGGKAVNREDKRSRR
jgi:hypothetical protein